MNDEPRDPPPPAEPGIDLEQAGYVSIEKKFVDRKPQTSVKLSKKGRLAFEHYVEVLEEIVRKK